MNQEDEMATSFCCATVDGKFVGKQAAFGPNRAEAASSAYNMLLLQCDPNIPQWIMASALRKLETQRALDVVEETIDA